MDQVPKDIIDFAVTYGGNSGCFLVCRRQEEIIGIVGYRHFDRRFRGPDGHPRSGLSYPDVVAVEVVRLFVSPRYRKRGVACKLVEKLVDAAREADVDVMYLHTHDFLVGAQSFWARNGWCFLEKDPEVPWKSVHMERWLASGGGFAEPSSMMSRIDSPSIGSFSTSYSL